MTTRHRGVLLVLVLLVTAGIVATVMFTGEQRDDDPSGTSAFDPSVPTSTHTPPAGSSSPAEDPSSPPVDTPSSGTDTTDPATSTVSPSAPVLTPKEQAEISIGTSELLSTVLAKTSEIDPSIPTDVVGELSDVASRSYLSELEAERLEFEAEGWIREGSYSLGEVEVLEHSSTSDGEVVTVRVCVDSSGLVTRRADGEALEASSSSARAWNVFVLERTDSTDWRIVGRTFPDNPAC